MCEVWEGSAWFGRGNWGWKVEGQKVGEVREPGMYVCVGEVACVGVGDGGGGVVEEDDRDDDDGDGKGGNEATAALSASSPRAIKVHL